MIHSKKALTIVEITIGVLISSVLLIVVLNLFSSGMKNSSKTLTHQDNMEAANILMSQIECDLQRATEIKHPGWNDSDNVANWVFQNKNVNITYTYDGATGLEGIRRIVNDNGKSMNTIFSKGHPVKIKFTHYAKPTSIEKGNIKNYEKHGMWVEVVVGTKNSDIASFTLKRLITIHSPK